MSEIIYKGIDLSKINGVVNFKELKNGGYNFVILRAGSGDHSDSKFEEYYQQAKESKLEIGCYWSSHATSLNDIKEETKTFLETIKDKKFSFPCYIKFSDNRTFKCNKAELTSMVNNWSTTIKSVGLIPGFYTDYKKVNKFNMSEIYCEKWLSKCSKYIDDYVTDEWSLWQYAIIGNSNESTRSGKIPGCNNCSAVNADYAYKDYPKMSGISFV